MEARFISYCPKSVLRDGIELPTRSAALGVGRADARPPLPALAASGRNGPILVLIRHLQLTSW